MFNWLKTKSKPDVAPDWSLNFNPSEFNYKPLKWQADWILEQTFKERARCDFNNIANKHRQDIMLFNVLDPVFEHILTMTDSASFNLHVYGRRHPFLIEQLILQTTLKMWRWRDLSLKTVVGVADLLLAQHVPGYTFDVKRPILTCLQSVIDEHSLRYQVCFKLPNREITPERLCLSVADLSPLRFDTEGRVESCSLELLEIEFVHTLTALMYKGPSALSEWDGLDEVVNALNDIKESIKSPVVHPDRLRQWRKSVAKYRHLPKYRRK